eukprot:gene36202-47079_t
MAFHSSENIALIYIAQYYFKNIAFQGLAFMTAHSEMVRDPFLYKYSAVVFIISTSQSVLGTFLTFYSQLYENDPIKRAIVVAIRQKSCLISYKRLTFSEKKYLFATFPNTAWALYRVMRFLINALNKTTFWKSQTETSVIIDNSLQLVYIGMISRIFNLELSWRGLDGSFHNKLSWAQILAERSNVTLAIEDSTLATGSASQAGDDLEGNYRVDQALLPQRDTYLHID